MRLYEEGAGAMFEILHCSSFYNREILYWIARSRPSVQVVVIVIVIVLSLLFVFVSIPI